MIGENRENGGKQLLKPAQFTDGSQAKSQSHLVIFMTVLIPSCLSEFSTFLCCSSLLPCSGFHALRSFLYSCHYKFLMPWGIQVSQTQSYMESTSYHYHINIGNSRSPYHLPVSDSRLLLSHFWNYTVSFVIFLPRVYYYGYWLLQILPGSHPVL